MKLVIGWVVAYFATYSVMLAFAVAMGLLLHWMIPGIDLGSAVLVGAISTLGSLHYFLRMIKGAQDLCDALELDEDGVVVPRGFAQRPPARRTRKPMKAWSARD